jgi:hypothetical protein
MKWRQRTSARKAAGKKDSRVEPTAWHGWFAWHPVRLSADHETVCWLEWVWRRIDLHSCPQNSNRFYEWVWLYKGVQ